MIPKIIHQTFPTRKLPSQLSEVSGNLCRLNPHWDYRFYDDAAIEQFIAHHYGAYHLDIYSRINPQYGAARADYFRYLVVYKLGGVYLDIKSTCLKPLDQFADDDYVLSHWHNFWGKHPEIPGGKEFQQWHIIASPEHPFLRDVIERVSDNIVRYQFDRSNVGFKAVLRTTGPIAYTLAIQPLLVSGNYRLVRGLFDCSLVYSTCWHISHFKPHYAKLKTPLIKSVT